jgi:FtsP/CotA-like multicopper oxidase with cupredoxin domain
MKRATYTSIVFAAVLLAGAPAAAHEVDLIAASFTKAMPDGRQVTMWGFAEDGNANGQLDAGEQPTVPGPQLEVPPGDDELTVNLHNQLPVPVSLVIPSQTTATQPVFFTDDQGRERVRSFTHETAPGASESYQWSSLRPGSHVYHSGTHPQVQVQMGLYGSVVHDVAGSTAYPGIEYTYSASIFYSEVDPELHDAVADDTYGSASYPSTVDYLPRYFLVNGEPFEAGSTPPLPAGVAGQPTLLRLFNMGLTTHVAMLQGVHAGVVAEDGFPYPYARRQYSVSLPAAKSRDVLFTPPTAGTYPLYDRRLRLSSAGQPDSGLLTKLEVAAPEDVPVAIDDSHGTDEDTLLEVAAPGVLANDGPAGASLTAELDGAVSDGTLTLHADGGFTYEPPADFHGTAMFQYRAVDGALQSAPATVQITVTPVNDAPVAVEDDYETLVDSDLTVDAPGVLENDSDADGDPMESQWVDGPTNGTLDLGSDGAFVYSPNAGFEGTDSFTYLADDGTAQSAPATVTITVAENQPPQANDDSATTDFKEPVTIDVLGNDTDVDGTLDPASVTVTTPPAGRNDTVVNADGSITYTPAPGFRGSDTFGYVVRDDAGAESNEATVQVEVIR